MGRVTTIVAALGTAWLATACVSSPVSMTRDGSNMGAVRPALPPIGFLKMCERLPNECYDSQSRSVAMMARRLADDLGAKRRHNEPAAIKAPARTGSPQWAGLFAAAEVVNRPRPALATDKLVLDLTSEAWDHLIDVNNLVNGRVISRSDQQAFGVSDYWQLPFGAAASPIGDCEDYVIQKRRLLIERGVHPSSLSIAIVKFGREMTHAVLLVETNQGQYVLDSLVPRILPWRQARYRWLERQVDGEAFTWTYGPPPQALAQLDD